MSLTLKPHAPKYTHSVDIFDLPQHIQRVLRTAANEEELGSHLDYEDGDYYVVPQWNEPEMRALSDEDLERLINEEEIDSIDHLKSQLSDDLSSYVVVEIARRYIIKALPEAELLMAERKLAINIWH